MLGLVRATLRADLALLTKSGMIEARPRVGYYYSENKSPSSQLLEDIRRIKVNDVKAVPAAVEENVSVYDAIVTMFVMDVGTLFIVSKGGFLEGVVSRKDLLKIAMGHGDINKVPITVVMTRMPNVVTVTPEEMLWKAAKKLVDHEIDALPVVRAAVNEGVEKLEVVGRITKTNITKVFVELGLGNLSRQRGEGK